MPPRRSSHYLPLPRFQREQAAWRRLCRLTYGKTSTLAYADAFRAVMLALIVATLLVPLMRKVVGPKPAASMGH